MNFFLEFLSFHRNFPRIRIFYIFTILQPPRSHCMFIGRSYFSFFCSYGPLFLTIMLIWRSISHCCVHMALYFLLFCSYGTLFLIFLFIWSSISHCCVHMALYFLLLSLYGPPIAHYFADTAPYFSLFCWYGPLSHFMFTVWSWRIWHFPLSLCFFDAVPY